MVGNHSLYLAHPQLPPWSDMVKTSVMDDLPAELLAKVLCWLDLQSLVRCRAICRTFRDLLDTHPELVYILELRVAGCVEAPQASTTLNVQERLVLLAQHLRSRRQLASWQPLSEKQGDATRLFSKLGQAHPQLPIYIGNILFFPYSTRSRGVQAYLPNVVECTSLTPDESGKLAVTGWSIKLENSFVRLAADPGQNLLVLLLAPSAPDNETVVQVQSIVPVTGVYDARRVTIPRRRVNDAAAKLTVPIVEIHGNTIAVVLLSIGDAKSAPQLDAVFIDLRTLQIITRFQHPCHELRSMRRIINERQYSPLVLLDETSFLVVSAEDTNGVIKVYRITAEVQDNLRKIAHIASYSLPPFNPGYTFVPSYACYYTSYSGKYVPWDQQTGPSTTSMFAVSSRDCILHLRLRYGPTSVLCDTTVREKKWRMLEVCYLIRLEPFFAAVDQYRSRSSTSIWLPDFDNVPVLIPWTQWGPKNSRSTRINSEGNYHVSHGLRTFFTNRYGGSWTSEVVMDFNTLPERRLRANRGSLPKLDDNQRYVDESEVSRVSREDVFVEDIIGTLPYIETAFPRLTNSIFRRMVVAGDVWVCRSARRLGWGQPEEAECATLGS